MAKKQEEKTKINNVIVHCKYDELIELGKLKPHPANPNIHPDKQIELLGKIMQKHGIRWPICVSNLSRYIISGHGRLMAANNLKLDKYPVVYQDFESESEELAVLVNDNKIAELAETNNSLMGDIILELDQNNYPLELTALSEEEIKYIIEGPTEKIEGNVNLPDSQFSVIIECKDESEQKKVYDESIEKGYSCRLLTL